MSIARQGGAARSVSPHAVAQLAAGGFLLLSGSLFAAPFLLNGRVQENDAFLNNLFLAPLIALLGSLLYILALRRLGFSLILTIALLILNLAALTSWLWLPQVTNRGVALAEGTLAWLPVILLVDTALLSLSGALVAWTQQSWDAWTRGMLLALVTGSALTVVYSFFGGQYLAFGEKTSSLPPYLNTTTLIASAALAALAYLLGWRWSRAQ
jgi:hypothetical protein